MLSARWSERRATMTGPPRSSQVSTNSRLTRACAAHEEQARSVAICSDWRASPRSGSRSSPIAASMSTAKARKLPRAWRDGPPTQAGICVIGHGVVFGPFNNEHTPVESVGRPIRNVTVEGFDIEGFTGPYVAVAGGRNVRVAGNELDEPVLFGVLSLGSRSTRVTGNEVHGALGFIGVCVHDAASPLVERNDIATMVIGVCVETTGTAVTRNEIHDNCIGIYVDPGIAATITHNDVFDNNQCPDLPSSGRGLTLSGAQGSVVSHNDFRGHTVGGLPALLITDDSNTRTVATDNTVTHNQFPN